jgi:hypothetical protein
MSRIIFPSARSLFVAAILVTAVMPSSHAGNMRSYSVTIAAVSTDKTLKLPDGGTTRAPVAPGAYAIIADGSRIFETGKQAPAGLESLAEDGMSEAFIASLKTMNGVREARKFIPGQSFKVTVAPGEKLVFAAMFVQSNDVFLAPPPEGIAFPDGGPGDATTSVMLWDSGTEVNEAPGAGANQAPRQAEPNTGTAEHGTVMPVADGFAYPPVNQVLKVTIASS